MIVDDVADDGRKCLHSLPVLVDFLAVAAAAAVVVGSSDSTAS